ncbi:hypothetical protein AVEN_40010-2-1, partial [Araneus ventricosus]
FTCAIAAFTCVDEPSSVAVFGLPDLLALTTEPVLLNFMRSFTTVLFMGFLRLDGSERRTVCYMTGVLTLPSCMRTLAS